MDSYRQQEIIENLPGIVLISHGPFAISLLKSAEMLFGQSPNVSAFALEVGDDVEAFRKEFSEEYNRMPEGSIIMMDLFGGTPCNQTIFYAKENHMDIPAICGMNLPMLIDAVTGREMCSGKELIEKLQTTGKDGVVKLDLETIIK